MTALILRANAACLPLPDDSVDLIVTSPPYFALRSYTDGGEHYAGQVGAEPTPGEYIDALLACTREWMRVLKPGGSMFVNLGDKYSTGNSGQSGLAKLGEQYRGGGHTDGKAKRRSGAVPGFRPKSLLMLPERYRIGCVDQLGLIARAVLVWSKPNGLPESVTDRVRRSHEDWVHLVRQPRYFSAVDAIREEHADPRPKAMTWQQRKDRGDPVRQGEQSGNFGAGMAASPLGKLPGSVWEIATEPLRIPDEVSHAKCCAGRKRDGCDDGLDHYAAFPTEWPRRLILGWSPAGGVVVDPFGGTGTTALVAAALGRTGVSVDLSADYCRLATWRTTDPGERARAMRVPKPEKPVTGQLGLFDGAAS